jgi:hypothetical protein
MRSLSRPIAAQSSEVNQHLRAGTCVPVMTCNDVLKKPTDEGISKSSGLPAVWDYTPDNRFIIVVYEEVAESSIRVVTAYEVCD